MTLLGGDLVAAMCRACVAFERQSRLSRLILHIGTSLRHLSGESR